MPPKPLNNGISIFVYMIYIVYLLIVFIIYIWYDLR